MGGQIVPADDEGGTAAQGDRKGSKAAGPLHQNLRRLSLGAGRANLNLLRVFKEDGLNSDESPHTLRVLQTLIMNAMKVNAIAAAFATAMFLVHRLVLHFWVQDYERFRFFFSCPSLYTNQQVGPPKIFLEMTFAFYLSAQYVVYLKLCFSPPSRRKRDLRYGIVVAFAACVVLAFAIIFAHEKLTESGWFTLQVGYGVGFLIIFLPDFGLLFGKYFSRPKAILWRLPVLLIKAFVMVLFGITSSMYVVASERVSGWADVVLNGKLERFSLSQTTWKNSPILQQGWHIHLFFQQCELVPIGSLKHLS